MSISYQQEVFRKLVHLSSLWMAAAMLILPRTVSVILFGVMFVLNVLVEYAHFKRVPVITPLYNVFFGRMLRKQTRDQFRLSGGPPVLAAACAVSLLFPPQIAATAFATMILGDTAAALIGRKWGRHRAFNGKSLEGSAAFAATGWLLVTIGTAVFGWPLNMWLWGMVGIVAADAAEFFNEQIHMDDNFTIPLLTGIFLSLPNLAG